MAGEVTEQFRGLVIQLDQDDVWCAVLPYRGTGETSKTFCGRVAVWYRAWTTDQQPTCPDCLRAMEVAYGSRENAGARLQPVRADVVPRLWVLQ